MQLRKQVESLLRTNTRLLIDTFVHDLEGISFRGNNKCHSSVSALFHLEDQANCNPLLQILKRKTICINYPFN